MKMNVKYIKEMNIKKQWLHTDIYCTKFVLTQINAIKKYFGINKTKRVYSLGGWDTRDYFLCDNKIYVIDFDYLNNDAYKPIIKSAYVITLKDKNTFDFDTIIPDDTTSKYREFRGIKINKTKKIYTIEDFKEWYNSPCCVNEAVNVSYQKAIEFLQNYKKTSFRSDRYLFYVKRDSDLTWLYFIYAYDLKNKVELKIYVDSYIFTEIPEKLSDIYVKDFSGKLSDYQKLQCKKEFFEYCRQECKELNALNFYALEFVKQCIQPIEKDRGWCVIRPFLCGSEFDNIWIDDVLRYDEKPYFLVCNNDQWHITKIAVLDFYKPEYKSTEPYINGYKKCNHWNIDKETLSRLVKFLKEPWDYYRTGFCEEYIKEKRTNWQRLVELYNENTAEYNDNYEKLPPDLPMPDYTKLAEGE